MQFLNLKERKKTHTKIHEDALTEMMVDGTGFQGSKLDQQH
jgi:hypothetical protein